MRTALFFALLLLTQCIEKKKDEPWVAQTKPPSSIIAVHADLLNKLTALTGHRDSTGRAALKLLELLTHHFQEEERYLLPVLGLLPELAREKLPADMDGPLRNVEWYKQNSQHLEVEHQFIRALMSELVTAAATDGHREAMELEVTLSLHAAEEEEVMFPAVRLAGLYLQKNLNGDPGPPGH